MEQSDPVAEFASARCLGELTGIVSRAAAAIVAIDRANVGWRAKSDRSPVSTADEAANAVMMEGLSRWMPGLPIVSEEGPAPPSLVEATSFILVDPLDGTREFLAGREEFTVNVAVVSDGRPVVGVIAAPALGVVWRGVVGHGAERLRLSPGALPQPATEICPVRTRRRPAHGFVAMVSRSHFDDKTDAFLKRLPITAQTPCGSSLKFTRIAEGSADLYARLAQTCEWDVAAGHAVLAAAGGIVTTPDGAGLLYGRRRDFHIPGFVAWGDPAAARNPDGGLFLSDQKSRLPITKRRVE
jgi:3'(2'), 5'-bisphosphate nucleotidase